MLIHVMASEGRRQDRRCEHRSTRHGSALRRAVRSPAPLDPCAAEPVVGHAGATARRCGYHYRSGARQMLKRGPADQRPVALYSQSRSAVRRRSKTSRKSSPLTSNALCPSCSAGTAATRREQRQAGVSTGSANCAARRKAAWRPAQVASARVKSCSASIPRPAGPPGSV